MALVPYNQLPRHLQDWLVRNRNPAYGPEQGAQALYQSLSNYGWQWPSHWGPPPADVTMFLGDLAGTQRSTVPAPAAPPRPPAAPPPPPSSSAPRSAPPIPATPYSAPAPVAAKPSVPLPAAPRPTAPSAPSAPASSVPPGWQSMVAAQSAPAAATPTASGLVPFEQLRPSLQNWLVQHRNQQRFGPGLEAQGAQALYQSLASHGWQWPSNWGAPPEDVTVFLGDLAGAQVWGQPTPTTPAPPIPTTPNSAPAAPGSSQVPFPVFDLPPYIQPPSWNWQDWSSMTPEQLEAATTYHQQLLPWVELGQNAYQYQQDFEENLRRFWEAQWPWQQTTDQFSMDLARQQFEESQKQYWEGDIALRKEELGWQKESFGQEYGLKTKEQEALEQWRDTQAQLQREQMQTEQENAAIATWGRKFRPNTRYL